MTQNSILIVLSAAVLAGIFVYAPLVIRLIRVALLDREVRDACHLDDRPGEEHRREITRAFSGSPLAWHWEEFMHRWQNSQTGGARERAPVRLIDIFDQRPLLPTGARRSLLPALPGLFLAIGVLGTFVGLTAAVAGNGIDLMDPVERAARTGLLADQIGLSLRAALWGLVLSIAAALVGRLIDGGFERYEESLDHWVERAFGAVSTGELANVAARAQRATLEGLGTELTRFTADLSERIDRGLSRIEHSTASAAQLVSDEQRGVLQKVVRELSLQVQRGVEEHLTALHQMLERAVDHQGAVTGGLAEAFEQMAANSETHVRVTQVLEGAALTMQDAAGSLSSTANDMTPVLEHLRDTGGAMQETAGSMRATQEVVSRSADGIRGSLDHASAAMTEQREFIECSLGEIRATLELMNTGLGENLDRALRGVDEALAHTVGRLRETISESNETIDRLALPVRAAEGTTREMHAALERVREEVVALGEWLGQAVRPVRTSLTQLEDRTTEVTRALVLFGDRAQTVDKTMDALRGEIHEEGRRLRLSSAELSRHLKRAADSAERLDRAPREAPSPVESAAAGSWTRVAPAPPPSTQIAPPVVTYTPAPDASAEPAPSGGAEVAEPASSRAVAPASEPEHDAAAPLVTQAAPAAPPAPEPPRVKRSATQMMVAAAAAASSEMTPTAGRRLGPDPYSRLGTDGEQALERQRRLLESARAMHHLDVDEDDDATLIEADEPKLSQLLGRRPARNTAAPEVDASAKDGTAPVQSDGGSDAGDQDGAATDRKGRPRTWRLIGKR